MPRPRVPSATTFAAMTALAHAARLRAQAPFSRFKVGAALKTRGGEIVTGANVESASYGLSVCAERVALWKAVSEGIGDFEAIVVVSGARKPTPPCGACRQVLWEHCGDVVVRMITLGGRSRTVRLSELLPLPFDAAAL